jgi:hypothetical protein
LKVPIIFFQLITLIIKGNIFFQILLFHQQTPNRKLPTGNCQPETANWELPTANWELPTANWELATANWELPTGNYAKNFPQSINNPSPFLLQFVRN